MEDDSRNRNQATLKLSDDETELFNNQLDTYSSFFSNEAHQNLKYEETRDRLKADLATNEYAVFEKVLAHRYNTQS